ncbi:MAG: hypothetical protein WA414_19115 [Acidobacteriaceae bacterium]
MISAIANHKSELIELCRPHHVQRLEVFGSSLGSGFDPDRSDFDFLVKFVHAYAHTDDRIVWDIVEYKGGDTGLMSEPESV